MAQRGKGKPRVQPDFVSALLSEDPFYDLLKGVLSDIQPGDLGIDPATDQVIYYDSARGSFTVPETPLTKAQFSHIFGNSQNHPTPVQLTLQQGTNCQLRGNFRVRTVSLTATTEENAVAGWNRVLDELCKMPSLRPKNYVVVDRKTHQKCRGVAVKKDKKGQAKEVEVIGNLRDVVSSYMLKKGVLGKIKTAVEGNVTLSLDLQAKSLTLAADSSTVLMKAMTETLSRISQISEQVQTLYWAVPIPPEFAQSLIAIWQLSSDFEDIYGFIPVAEVVFSPEITPILLGIQHKFLPITAGAPVSITLVTEEIEGNGELIPEMRADLANTSQLTQLHTLLYQELTNVQASCSPVAGPLALHVAVMSETRFPALSLVLPTGLETRHLCLGRPGSFPSIELSLV